jgi:Ras-related protein Rab-8A
MVSEPDASYDHLIKLLIVGDDSGKSSLFLRFTDDDYSPSYYSTIGVFFKSCTVEIHNKRCELQIWDTASAERFRSITTRCYRGAMGFLLVYDITNEQSFANIRNWHVL